MNRLGQHKPASLLLASLIFGAACVSNAAAQVGTFTDARDGRAYRTAKMPDGKTWMAENLDYAPKKGNSWCYNNKGAYCGQYGRLYDWYAAKGACPAGWHLPSRQEWTGLAAAAGGANKGLVGRDLKAGAGWNYDRNGTDAYGFSALPGGYRYADGNFGYAGTHGDWWTATQYGSNYAYKRYIIDYNYESLKEFHNPKEFGFSVRCVQD